MLFCNNSFCEGTVRSKSVLTLLRVTEEVAAKLMESAYHQIERDGILATRLCTHKDDVELTNENKLQQLPGLNSPLCLFGFFFFQVLFDSDPGENWQNYHLWHESCFFSASAGCHLFSDSCHFLFWYTFNL